MIYFLFVSCLSLAKVDFPIDPQNDPLKIIWNLGGEYSRNIKTMLDKKSGEVKKRPWSGYYWPDVQGSIAARLSDPEFSRISRSTQIERVLPQLINYIRRNDAISYSSFPRKNLSPAEKYDLWVGDRNLTLTNAVLNNSFKYYKQQNGNLPKWFGLCHGWAPASIMVDRPTRAVTVPSGLTGEQITFYPKDIKALATLAWTKKAQTVIGLRCNASNIDFNNRASIPKSCLDLNPGSLHIALVNQVGVNKKPLILDVSSNSEVWNHPVSKYKFQYFNPVERVIYNDFERDVEDINRVSLFRAYRSPETKYIIGVKLTLEYLNENYNLSRLTDDPRYDSLVKKEIYYDLELNEKYEIVGGEWLSSNYPDFAWIPNQSKHTVFGEDTASLLNDDGSVTRATKSLTSGGILGQYRYNGYSKERMPLPNLVRYLVEKAK